MAGSGRDELELFLDDAPAVKAAKSIQKSYDDLAKQLAATARTFDQNYAAAFGNVQRASEQTARKIKHDADEANTKLRTLNQGFKDFALGSFAGGLSANAVATALQQTLQFAQSAGQAYLEGNRAATFLESTTKRYNQSLVETQAQVARLRKEYNLSQTDAERALGQATRAAAIAGDPSKGFALLTGATNLAEASGVTKDRIPDIIRQIASGQDEAFDALFGKNPSNFYDEWAKANGRTSASLTDLEKAQIRVNTVVTAGATYVKEHETHVASAAGQWERWTAALADFQRQAGEQGIGLVSGLIDNTARGVERILTGRRPEDPTAAELAAAAEANRKNQADYAAKANAPAEAAARLRAQQEQALRDIQSALDYAEKARAARDQGPLADVRRATKAEIDRILKANTDNGQLSGAGLAQIGIAASFGAADEAKKILEVNKQLDAQLAEMKAKYSGDQNPLTQLAISGKREMDALIETLKKLGPEFEVQSTAVIAAAAKLQNLNFAKGLVSSVIDISNIQARIDSLTPDLVSAAAVGAYGQITDQFTVRESYKKETDVEKAKRLIAALDQEKAAYGGDSDY